MAIDAPVILAALLFTIIAIVVASAFLSRRSAPNKPKQNRQETRPEEEDEYQHKAEELASAPVVEANKEPSADDKGEDLPLAVEDLGLEDESAVDEAGLSLVQEAQIQAAAAPEVACGQKALHHPTHVDIITFEPVFEALDVPVSVPAPEQTPGDTVPELISELAPEQVSEPCEPAQEPATKLDAEHAPGLISEPAADVLESSSETISEPIPEHVLESITERVSEVIAEQVSEDISMQVSVPSDEQISEEVPEPILDAQAELTPEVLPEIAEASDMAAAPAEAEEKVPNFKFGKKRTNKFEKRMTKDELEEEQRVQREQLSAIFNLLRDNHETFGEVTEEDIEEQFKLYTC
ncbi:uncharacterized protein LOC143482953 isoform X2 [Brachyhypopomus gauderio]|uniref:uncharacterized protein LOC143482953 isoform X2 n=1 Tax=Brachyhypopomus gauderio TaxID=698409 RepID=UPI004042A3B0